MKKMFNEGGTYNAGQYLTGSASGAEHGLINYIDTKALLGFSQKLTSRKILRHYFANLADKSVFMQYLTGSECFRG
jgi:hypothetical protein